MSVEIQEHMAMNTRLVPLFSQEKSHVKKPREFQEFRSWWNFSGEKES